MAGLLISLVTGLAPAQGVPFQPEPATTREPNFGIYAAEAAGGLVGGLAGFAAGSILGAYLFYNPAHDMSALQGTILVGVPVAGIGCAAGTFGLGNAFHQEGRFLPTLAWGVGSALAGLGIYSGGVALMNRVNGPDVVWNIGEGLMCSSWVVPVVLTAVGYNLSRPRDPYGARLVPGSVTLGIARSAEGTRSSVDVRLVSFRF